MLRECVYTSVHFKTRKKTKGKNMVWLKDNSKFIAPPLLVGRTEDTAALLDKGILTQNSLAGSDLGDSDLITLVCDIFCVFSYQYDSFALLGLLNFQIFISFDTVYC